MTNKGNTVLYTGVTNDLGKRIFERKQKLVEGFTKKYKVNKLVYYESFDEMMDVIIREKQIKGWIRKKKIDLIESMNPTGRDLYEDVAYV